MPTDNLPEEPSATPPPSEPSYAPPPPYAPPPGAIPPGPPPGFTPAAPPGPTPSGRRSDFLIGMAIGVIPLILAMIGVGSFYNYSSGSSIFANFLMIGAIGWVIGLVLSIILSIVGPTRRLGLGMLTAILASPVIFFIGCLVAISHPLPAGGTST